MKLLVSGLNYAPEQTGTGKYTAEMCEWMAARGHEVTVVCGLPHYPNWSLDPAYKFGKRRKEIIGGVRVLRAGHPIPSASKLSALSRIKLELGFTLASARYWIRFLFCIRKPDVVVAVMPPMQIGVWPLLFARIRRVPLVLHVQDLQVDAAIRLKMLKVGVLGKLLYGVERWLLRGATRVSTITPPMRDRIISKEVPEERTWLFPNWSDVQAIRPGPRVNGFRHNLGIGDDTVVALYAGNMGEKQGLDLILDAASLCSDEGGLIFLMVGAGAERPKLEARAARLGLANLRFLPLHPVERLSEMLAAGDIHLVVQRRDAADLVMPSKLTNILAAGRACVVTADPGTALHEVVHGHDTGEVVAPGDDQALTTAIRVLAGDAARREACGRRAREYAERCLDKERILAAFENQLTNLCERAPR